MSGVATEAVASAPIRLDALPIYIGGGGNSLERVTLVALCNGVIRTGGNRGGVAVGRAEPLIGNRGVGIVGARRRGQDLALDRTAADERRRHRGGGVGDDRGRRAGGADQGAAGHIGGGGNSLERVTLVALCNGVIRTGGNRGGVAVGRAEPLIGNRGVGIVGARRRGQDLALDRTAADDRRRHRGGGVGDDRGRRAGGADQGAAGHIGGGGNSLERVTLVALCNGVIRTGGNRGGVIGR